VSGLTLSTRDFTGLLTDAVLTASDSPDEYPILATVLIDTDHADVLVTSEDDGDGDTLIDTVPSDVLIATSTNGYDMVGQGHAPCEGRLHKPVLISVQDAQSLIKTFTAKGKTAPKGVPHQTRVEITGETLTVSEAVSYRSRGISMVIPLMELDDYPASVARSLDPDPSVEVFDDKKQPIPPSYGSGLAAANLEIVAKVANRRKMVPALYKIHQRRPVIVEVGSMYRAAFGAAKLDEDNGQHLGPQVRVFEPRLPAKKEERTTPPLTGVDA
jgi:hypothetical protein